MKTKKKKLIKEECVILKGVIKVKGFKADRDETILPKRDFSFSFKETDSVFKKHNNGRIA